MGESELILSQLLREDTPPEDEPDYSDRLLQALLRQAALTGRYVASGVGGMGAAFANPLAYGANKGLEAVGSDYRFPEQHGALMGALTDMGVPEPQGTLEKAVGFASEIGVPDPTDSAKLVSSLSHMIDPNLAMTVFHGSPHKWDKPDLSKVGTGEGAQAYGHGFYVAEAPDVAGTYRNADRKFLRADGQPEMTVTYKGGDVPEEHADLAGYLLDPLVMSEAKDAKGLADLLEELNPKSAQWIREHADDLAIAERGHLYELDLPDSTIEKMLDWDKPLSEQPESVRKALNAQGFDDDEIVEVMKMYGNNDGRGFYDFLTSEITNGSEEAASKWLNEAGIPGIKYLDGTSRSKGEGTRNFVVFNEKYVKPLKRDGKPIKEK